MTFRETTEFLPFWRAVLRYRYVTNITAICGYTTTWVDYKRVDGHLQEVALDYDDSVPCVSAIPALPCQTSVRPHHGDLKHLVVHLHWTNGNILVQGRTCRSWVHGDVRRLQAVVRTLAESVSLTQTQPQPGTKPPPSLPPPLPAVEDPEGVVPSDTSPPVVANGAVALLHGSRTYNNFNLNDSRRVSLTTTSTSLLRAAPRPPPALSPADVTSASPSAPPSAVPPIAVTSASHQHHQRHHQLSL